MDQILQAQLLESRFLRRPMKENMADAGYTRWLTKPVSQSRVLPLAEDFNALRHTGPGTMSVCHEITHSGKGSICLESRTSTAIKNAANRTYASTAMLRPLDDEDIRSYNRISLWVYLDAPGFASMFFSVSLHNAGEHIMPQPGRFEGATFEAVEPGAWHRIIWEMPDIYRDHATGISVSVSLPGSPAGATETMRVYIDDLRLETVEPENSRGFDLRQNAIAYCHSGYRAGARKQALVQHCSAASFTLTDESGATAFTGAVEQLENAFALLDFTSFDTQGRYSIQAGDLFSKPFAIGEDAYLAAAWKTLSFFYSERCGYDVPWIHAECHLDAYVKHPDGRTLPVHGGWHDAADLTQGVGNTAEIIIALLELAQSVKNKDETLCERLLEEARWGLNWVMRTRFGDGYRHGGMILGIWTKNMRGDKDDMFTDAQNRTFDNLLCAYTCAFAAPFFAWDANFSAWCLNCAREDFAFGLDRIDAEASGRTQAVETYGMAAGAAAMLYSATKEAPYTQQAAYYIRRVVNCQQLALREDFAIPLRGYFYEDETCARPVSYFHRSLEHLLLQGQCMMLELAPEHADAPLWRESAQAYGEYIRAIAGVMEPYGILPAGIYEVDNTDYSSIYHEGAAVGLPTMEEYNAQVKNGIRLNDTTYLRLFPVAYQFRGFHAPLMGKAKCCFYLARTLGEREFYDIAARQLEYILGFNPFAMSTMYGEGYDFPPLYGGFAVQPVGAVPVGIETFENDDEPYMPMQNNCTYKEIWVHTTARAMWLIAELFR